MFKRTCTKYIEAKAMQALQKKKGMEGITSLGALRYSLAYCT